MAGAYQPASGHDIRTDAYVASRSAGVSVDRLTRDLVGTTLECEPVLSPAARRRPAVSARTPKETAMQYEDTTESADAD